LLSGGGQRGAKPLAAEFLPAVTELARAVGRVGIFPA
jgi:hypothetical protein